MVEYNDYLNVLKNQSILIIEDNRADFILLKDTILSYAPETEILYAECLGDAYKVYKRRQYDLVLLDLNLPDGYGPGTLREVKKFHGHIPIIVVTSMVTDQIKTNVFRMGADGIISKDFLEHPKLLEMLKSYCPDISLSPDKTAENAQDVLFTIAERARKTIH